MIALASVVELLLADKTVRLVPILKFPSYIDHAGPSSLRSKVSEKMDDVGRGVLLVVGAVVVALRTTWTVLSQSPKSFWLHEEV